MPTPAPPSIFVRNPAGFAAMVRAPFMRKAMLDAGKTVKARAEVLSAVDTGRYKRSWYARLIAGTGPATVEVGNTVPYAGYLEFGTSKMRAHRTLGRAITSVNIT
jgi:HK97 gp10 family phage protein